MRPFERPEEFLRALDATAASQLLTQVADLSMVVDSAGIVRDVATGSDDAPATAADWVGRPLVDLVSLDSHPKVEAMRDRSGGQPRWRQINFSAVQPSWAAQCLVLPLPAGKGVGPRDIVFARDLGAVSVLQQRLVEAQQAMERDYWSFRQAETRYRHLFHVAQEGVLVVDAGALKVLEANPAAVALLGRAAGHELVGSTFPAGLDARSQLRVENMVASVRATGRADHVRAELANAEGEVEVSVSAFRQDTNAQLMVRVSPAGAVRDDLESPTQAMLLRLAQGAPDGLVVTDLEGRVLSANSAFVELAQLGAEEQARGQSLDRWLGRSGVDLSVLISNLRQRGAVRLFATTLRGEFGGATDVEISASVVPHGEQSFLGFTIRDVGRRLSSDVGGAQSPDMARAVGRLTELVGRMPLKEIVGETSDLIERLCIEAALELTRDNRASAAEMLGLSRQSLYVKLRRHGLGELPGSS